MLAFFLGVTGLCTLISAVVLFSGFALSQSAPQQAAVAALALAICVIPYIFTRCLQISADEARQKKAIADVLTALHSGHSIESKPDQVSASGVKTIDVTLPEIFNKVPGR